MRVILFRHGIAHDRADPACPPDPERALTEDGKKKTRKAARGLLRMGVAPSRILTSPYVRARQTTDILAEVLGVPEDHVTVTDALVPEAAAYSIFHSLYAFEGTDEEIVCVGHAPNVDKVITLALTGGRTPVTSLKKAGAACLDVTQLPRTHGQLLWLIPPKVLGDLD